MKIKHLITVLLFLTISTKSFATFWQSFVVYRVDTTAGSASMPFDYLRPEVYCGYYGSSTTVASFLGIDYEKVKYEDDKLRIYIDANELSYIEENEYITTVLMNGFDAVTIVFKNGAESTYTREDISLPFFLPVYFESEEVGDLALFIRNALDMIRIRDKQIDIDFKYFIIHKVSAGETLFGISRRYGISQEELIKYNPILETSTLKAEQKIIIYYNEDSPYSDRVVYQDTTTETIPDSPNILNIILFVLLGISLLLNGWFIWKFLMQKK